MVIEGGGGRQMEPVAQLFKAAAPELKWTDLAHYGARKGNLFGTPYGYVMSVWGNQTPFKSKQWGAGDLPLVLIEHFRADPLIDLRPVSSRGSLYWAADTAMGGTRGIGPLGADFWNLTAAEKGPRAGTGPLEGYITNLSMYGFSTAAFLAPGPEGPLTTARFDIFREGLQVCEAHAVIEKALGDPAKRQQLGDALVRRCEELKKEREQLRGFVGAGERFAQGEGWKWFETSGWEELAGRLFDCAEQVARAAGGK
jgi:hypothetical protein